MTSASLPPAWAGAFAAAKPGLPTAPWMASRREEAWERFRARGFPGPREEDWRTTRVTAVERGDFSPAPPPTPADLDAARRLLGALRGGPAPGAVFVNGRHVPGLSDARPAPGLEVLPLATALRDPSGAAARHLGRLATGGEHSFSALNAALWTDGALVRFTAAPPGDAAVHLVFLAVGAAGRATYPRVLYVVEPGARGRILETWGGETEGASLVNPVLEGWVGAGARLEILETQLLPEGTLHFRTARFHVEADAVLAATTFADGATVARSDLGVVLASPGASCRLDGLTLLRGTRHADHQTRIEHRAPHGTSRQVYKAVVDDRARYAFAGRVSVPPGAFATDARQASHNLLLSREAVAEAKPELEILADDVKCSHGATVGQIDETGLFYLRSRGIGEAEARSLLLTAFAGEVAARVEDPALRARLEAILAARLGAGR